MRHIDIAEVFVLACVMMNSIFILNSVDDLWNTRNGVISKVPKIIKQRVCVLVTGGNASGLLSSLATSINGDHSYSYGVFTVDYLPPRKWFEHSFPVDTMMHSVSSKDSLLFAAGVKGCSFFFIVNNHVRFGGVGWANLLIGALRGLNPPFIGAAMGCSDCIFIHRVHLQIFHQTYHFPPKTCWVQWIWSVYGKCRVVIKNVVSNPRTACADNNHRVNVSSGRLRVSKFLLSLGSPRCS